MACLTILLQTPPHCLNKYRMLSTVPSGTGSSLLRGTQLFCLSPTSTGIGGKKGSVEKCPLCKGRGMQIHIQQIGPGMVQQIQTVCIECKGQGERINPKDRCENCSGAKVTREKKIIEVHVEKGEAEHLVLQGPTLLIMTHTGLGVRDVAKCGSMFTRQTLPGDPFQVIILLPGLRRINEVTENLLEVFLML